MTINKIKEGVSFTTARIIIPPESPSMAFTPLI